MHVNWLKKLAPYLIVVAVAAAVYFSFAFVYIKILRLPPIEELIPLIEDLFARYGYWVVFIGAFVEGILLVNWYLPGSIVVVLGVAFARGGPLNVFAVIGLIILAFLITTIFNYALGRFGWYRLLLRFGLGSSLDRVKSRVEHRGLPIIFSTYFHPNFGALTATSAGILHLPFKRFVIYSLAALVAWNTLWGAIVYFFGDGLLEYATSTVVSIMFAVWILAFVYAAFKKRSASPPPIS